MTKPGGRIGMVLPSGLATDQGSAALRRHLLAQCDVDALVGFDNQHGVFPIHRSVRFLLVTAARGAPTRTIACRLGERNPASLESIGDESSAHIGVVHRASHARAAAAPVRRRPRDSGSAQRRGRHDSRARGDAVSAAWKPGRVERPLRPRTERHRRSRALRTARPRTAGRRGQADRALPRRSSSRPIQPGCRPRPGAFSNRPATAIGASPTATSPARPIASRSSPRFFPQDASRRTPCSACARRSRAWNRSTSAASSTASS